jgi:hypothetical protein
VLSLVYLIDIIKDIQNKANVKLLKLPEVQPDYENKDFSTGKFDVIVAFNSIQWNARKKVNEKSLVFTDLIVPYPIAQCPNPDCEKYIPRFYFTHEPHKCPFCGFKLPAPPEKGSGPPTGLDTDSDGIPDHLELQYGFDPNDPKDAAFDSDSDGFPNHFETQSGTNPKDPKSHPPLAMRLFVRGILRMKMGVMLKGLQISGENRGDWNIQLDVVEGGRVKTVFVKLNSTVTVDGQEYKIIDCVPKKEKVFDEKLKMEVEKDLSEVTLQAMNSDDKVVLVLREPVFSPREKAYLRDIPTGRYYNHMIDETFTMGDENIGKEEYKVLSIDSQLNQVQLMNMKDNSIIGVSKERRFEYQQDTQEQAASGAMRRR